MTIKYLGKKEGTIGLNNCLWIKKFENGVKIRKKKEGEITLNVTEVFETLQFLRKFCKRDAFPIFLTALDLTYVWQKYPKTKEFVEKLLTDEVTYEEKMKIHETYMTKHKILESLED
jgi:hypothetical protein